jgi:hypothetical protein
MGKGICRNAFCSNGAQGTPIDRYPGPGEYCPECGEVLEPVPEAPQPVPSGAPFGGLTALEALERFAGTPAPATPPPRPSRWPKRIAIVACSVVLAAGVAVTALRPTAVGHPTRSDAIRVCRSSLTDRFASDVVHAYAEKARVATSRFELSRTAPCDVRFVARSTPGDADIVGRDGLVAIVNPQNPMTRLTPNELRQIFSGAITDWAEVGGPPGAIEALLPDEASDEAQLLDKTLLSGVATGARALRLPASGNVVRAVTAPSGRLAIGLVAFSAAVPAKVLKLGAAPAPSTLSIGDRRYPLSIAVMVEADPTARGAAAAFARYARSDDVQSIVERDGFVPKKGF